MESAGGAITPWSEALLATGYPLDWRERRERNVRSFIDLWKTTSWRKSNAELLFDHWPVGHCPFNPVLMFASAESRDICRQRLIEAKIYPPVHWPIRLGDSKNRATVLSQRILTIPLDFRCNELDIERIVRTLFDHGGRHVSQP